MKYKKRFRIFIPIFIIAPVLVLVLCMGVGQYPISYGDVFKSLIQMFGIDMGVDKITFAFAINFRFQRLILAMLCGAGLSVAGAAVQATFSNPLATPETMGVSAGASFGAALAILLGLTGIALQSVAFAFGLLAVFICLIVSRTKGRSSIIMIILAGTCIASVFQAGLSIIQVMADKTDELPQIVFWLMGSFANTFQDEVLLMLPFLITGIVAIFLLRWRLNILTLNENEAESLGIKVKTLRILMILAATMITASCVSVCGIVGWVGMLIPHICRMIFGSNNKYVVPASISFGAVFLAVMDTLARGLFPVELPISVLTAIFGAPLFIILLKKTRAGAA